MYCFSVEVVETEEEVNGSQNGEENPPLSRTSSISSKKGKFTVTIRNISVLDVL